VKWREFRDGAWLPEWKRADPDNPWSFSWRVWLLLVALGAVVFWLESLR
jgi:hypothetical protein